jgi:hypothetical protein
MSVFTKLPLFCLVYISFNLINWSAWAQIPPQYSCQPVNNIPVTAWGNTLNLPWVGGLNNPQFSEADLNNDGTNDLFIFDRGDNTIITLQNAGIANEINYTHAPQLATNFPDLVNWVLLRDYNNDGIADIFANNNNEGIILYKGYYDAQNHLAFTLENQALSFLPDKQTLFVASYDFPDINDIDGDGDLDILTFESGGGYVDWYENTAEPNQMPIFIKNTKCWGEFYESEFYSSLKLNDCGGLPPPPAPSGKTSSSSSGGVHAGSTLTTFDADNDGDMDLLLGDLSRNNVVLAFNGGTPTQALITKQDTVFPANDKACILRTFPATFLADIDNDGDRDFLASPNAAVQGEHFECAWMYRNTADDLSPVFKFETDTFLVNQTLDFSRVAHPAFFDHNSDGLLDILVGNLGYSGQDADEYISQLALLQNVGTPTQPAYQLITRNYLNIQNQFALPHADLKPCFGDIDDDGDQDLLLGDKEGYVHLFLNNPTLDGISKFSLAPNGEYLQGQGIDVFQSNSPQLVDVDKDGLLDLVMGHHSGGLEFWRNIGTKTQPEFKQTTKFWGKVDVKSAGSFSGFAVPFLFDWAGKWLLAVGNEAGKILLYDNIETHIFDGAAFNLVTNNFADLKGLNRANPAIADVDNDGLLDIVIGTQRGGLIWREMLFPVGINTPENNHNGNSIYPDENSSYIKINLWPNPVNSITDSWHVQLPAGFYSSNPNAPVFYTVTNVQG